MAEHWDIHLIHPLDLLGKHYVDGYTDEGKAAKLSFSLDEWKVDSRAFAIGFSNADSSIIVPSNNIAMTEVWED